MMKKRLTRRLFAVCLGLIIALSACACASTDVDAPSDSSSADEISKETSALEQSQPHAESDMSETESSAVSEESEHSDETVSTSPVEPTYPEERETTLEYVKEYPVGVGGIPYYLVYSVDPEYAGIEMPYDYCLDEKGNLYANFMACLWDLQTNTSVLFETTEVVAAYLYAYDGKIYYTATDGTVNVFSPEKGVESKVRLSEPDKPPYWKIFSTDGGVPMVYRDTELFDAKGKKVKADYSVQMDDGIATVAGIEYHLGEKKSARIVGNMDGILTVRSFDGVKFADESVVREVIYYQYDSKGNPISEFAIYQLKTREFLPCQLEQNGDVCKWYTGYTVQIGKYCFEGVLSAYYMLGGDNQIYALLIYPDRAELYRINPGYSDVTPIDFDNAQSPMESPETWEGVFAEDVLDSLRDETVSTSPVEPTYPEERETTLEFVKEYPLGGEGGIPFYLLYENDPTIADIIMPWFLADENGNIYAYNGERFYDLQNKTSFVPPREERLIAREIAIDEKLYCLTLDGTLNVYTSQGKKVDSVQYPKRSENGTYDLFAAPDGTLRVVVDGTFYNASGKKIASDYVLDSVNQKADSLDLLGREYFYSNDLYVKCYAGEILTAYESQCNTVYTDGLAEIDEYLIYQYDKNGDPLSEFMIYRLEQSEKVSCDMIYEDVVCKSFTPCSIVVGKHRFDNLIDADWFVGADGTIYLMLIDPNGGKLYKVNPGYSDVEFTEDVPIEPTYPEERETTLELVKEYPLGGEGGIPFYLLYENDPEYAMIVTPDSFLMDKNGELYAYVSGYVYDIQTSERIRIDKRNNPIISLYMYNGKIYSTALDGTLNTHSFENGLESSVQIVDDGSDEVLYVHPSADGTPLVNDSLRFYGAKGDEVSCNYRLSSGGGITVGKVDFSLKNNDNLLFLSNLESVLTFQEHDYASYLSRAWVDEYIFYQFDAMSTPVSKFAVYQLWSPENLPCNMIAEDVVCKWYHGTDVLIGKQLFEDVLSARYFMGADNRLYAMIIYPDRAELYKINPGYSDVTPIDFDKMEDPAESPETWGEVFAEDVLAALRDETVSTSPVEPTYPEERETTLEKLATFETGKEGLFEYGFVYETDPSDPTIELPIHYCADAKGNVYADTRVGIVCLNNGTVLRDSGKPIGDMIVCGEELFVLYLDGEICRYQLQNGLENALLVKTYRYDMLADLFAKRLMDVGMDEPVIAVDEQFFYLSNNDRLTEYQAPYQFLTDATEYTLSIVDGRFFGIGTVNGRQPWVVSVQNGITLRVSQKNETKDGTVYESLYSGYDAQGNLQSAYLMSYRKQGDVACEIRYDAGVVRAYQGQSVAVEKNIFDNVLSHEMVAGKNGEFYLVLYYANHGEVYKITPGYSDVVFSALTEIDGAET